MGAISGAAVLALIAWAVARAVKRSRGRPRPPRPPVSRQATPHRRSRAQHDADVIGGWMLGHQVARGHHGFPGDPLPGGHLGAPQDLAFWGGVLDDEDDDPDKDG